VQFERSQQLNGETAGCKVALGLQRTQPYPAADVNRCFDHAPIDALIDLKISGPHADTSANVGYGATSSESSAPAICLLESFTAKISMTATAPAVPFSLMQLPTPPRHGDWVR
jgi:hypothetical protein